MAEELDLIVNGEAHRVSAEPDTPLLYVLIDDLALRGPKFGCGLAQCGACSVLVDGREVRACVFPAASARGREVTTIEGLTGPQVAALKSAWTEVDVVQCGYCQSGQLMTAAALLRQIPKPTDADIDAAMSGTLCRCGTYPRIRAAIHRAAALAAT